MTFSFVQVAQASKFPTNLSNSLHKALDGDGRDNLSDQVMKN